MRDRVSGGARVAAAAALLGAAARAGAGQTGAAAPDLPADAPSLIAGPSTCPLPAAIWAELGTLVPRERFEARLRAAAAAAPPVEILDLGVSYRVIAAGRVRTYPDEGRDCAGRARIAALFVALAIDPADIVTEAPPPRPLPLVPLTPPAPPEPPAPPPPARLDVAVAGDAGVGSAATTFHGGLALGGAMGRGRLAAVARVELFAPVDTTIGGVRVHEWRVPLFGGVRGQLGGRRVEPWADLGLEAAWLSERASDLAAPQSANALELGLGASLGARLAGRAAPFAALHAELVPSPPALFVLPQGVVGHTPTFWIGLAAGMSLGLGR